MTHCPTCRRRVVQFGADGRVKIRTKLIALEKGEAVVVCGNCGSDVPVDLKEGPTLRKAPRVVVRKP